MHGPSEVTGSDMVAAMAAAGVDAAIIVSPLVDLPMGSNLVIADELRGRLILPDGFPNC